MLVFALIVAVIVLGLLLDRVLTARDQANRLVYDQLVAAHRIRDIETQTIHEMLRVAEEERYGDVIDGTATETSDQ